MRCIRKDLSTSAATDGDLLWSGKGSGTVKDGSLWRVKPPGGFQTGYYN